mmetsp:Transcript_53883/g.117966  ORF Transcript_53883/g.117966 Transcript_53883/m.117966 type:complete len:178 (+) Transcript_53883:2100-2633(+)
MAGCRGCNQVPTEGRNRMKARLLSFGHGLAAVVDDPKIDEGTLLWEALCIKFIKRASLCSFSWFGKSTPGFTRQYSCAASSADRGLAAPWPQSRGGFCIHVPTDGKWAKFSVCAASAQMSVKFCTGTPQATWAERAESCEGLDLQGMKGCAEGRKRNGTELGIAHGAQTGHISVVLD